MKIRSGGTCSGDHVCGASTLGISVGEEGWAGDRRLQEGLQEITAPKLAINSSPTHIETAQRHGIEVVQLSGVGHFVMLEDPQTFNRLVDEAVQKFIRESAVGPQHTKV